MNCRDNPMKLPTGAWIDPGDTYHDPAIDDRDCLGDIQVELGCSSESMINHATGEYPAYRLLESADAFDMATARTSGGRSSPGSSCTAWRGEPPRAPRRLRPHARALRAPGRLRVRRG